MLAMRYDVIIIGAGAAGLMAMKELLVAGYSVCLLEATPVAGGRILTIREQGFQEPIEAGAEFIHGKLPFTLQLLKEANTPVMPVSGDMISVQRGKWLQEQEHDNHWELFMHELSLLKKDMSIKSFLDQYFSAPEYEGLCKSVQGFAEGFDLADITKASIFSVRDEWSHENEKQYRIEGGYIQLINYLEKACSHQKGVLQFNAWVKKIKYNHERVKVYTIGNGEFEASRLIVTVSAGVLQSGDIEFVPSIGEHAHAISQLGYGSVIKILLQFRNPFWRNYSDNIGFIFSDEEIPTWWTQSPASTNLLTGWLGGQKAFAKESETKESLLASSLKYLSSIFSLPVDELERELIHHRIFCWNNLPYVKGGYSYNTVESAAAKKILSQPVEDILFFAGEAYSDGESQGTVEAALQSGHAVAGKVITSLQRHYVK